MWTRLNTLFRTLNHNKYVTLQKNWYSSAKRPEISQLPTLLDFGSREIFNEDHDLLRENVRRFFDEEVKPHHPRWEEQGNVDKEVWLKAGKAGLLGVQTKEEHHGHGGDRLSAAIIWEEQGISNCSGVGFALHSDIVMPYISNYGTREQIDRYLPKMTAGEVIGAIAMTEPSAGSDLQGVRTNAKKDGDDWILNGSKVFITNGYMCDVALVVALTNPDAKSAAHGISLFMVDANTPGFIKGQKLKKMGMKAQDTAELFFEDVRLPSSQLLGEANKGFYYLMNELPQERLLIGAICQGTSEWAFEETRAYVKQRKAFGKTIADLQTVQHRLANMKTEICVVRAFMDQCYRLHNEYRLDSATASMVKMKASDLMESVTQECVQLHGGWGYMWEYPICKAYVDSKVQTIYGGTNEIMKELIARTIVKD